MKKNILLFMALLSAASAQAGNLTHRLQFDPLGSVESMFLSLNAVSGLRETNRLNI
jgi:hypothetical protein